MEYLIEEKKGFKIVGLAVDTAPQKALVDIPRLWNEFLKRNKEISKVVGACGYGVCFDTNKEKKKFRYIACKEVSDFENVPGGMVMAEVEESRYAVFTHKGLLENLGSTYDKIMALVEEKKMKKKEFWIEFYGPRWKGNNPESEMGILVAIE